MYYTCIIIIIMKTKLLYVILFNTSYTTPMINITNIYQYWDVSIDFNAHQDLGHGQGSVIYM